MVPMYQVSRFRLNDSLKMYEKSNQQIVKIMLSKEATIRMTKEISLGVTFAVAVGGREMHVVAFSRQDLQKGTKILAADGTPIEVVKVEKQLATRLVDLERPGRICWLIWRHLHDHGS